MSPDPFRAASSLPLVRSASAAIVLSCLAACGGGGGDGASTPPFTAPPAAAQALQCFNLALLETPGTTLRIELDLSGVASGTQTVVTTVGNLTTFDGNSSREVVTTAVGSTSASGTPISTDLETRSYRVATSAGVITEYGATARAIITIGGSTGSSNSRSVSNPPSVDRRYTLSAGQSDTLTGTVTTATTTNGVTTTQTENLSQTVRFVGIESVTVPAGSFNACKFEQAPTNAPADVTTSWVAVGSGVVVRTVAVSSIGTQTASARTIRINGVAP
jgi:hypothetical protein